MPPPPPPCRTRQPVPDRPPGRTDGAATAGRPTFPHLLEIAVLTADHFDRHHLPISYPGGLEHAPVRAAPDERGVGGVVVPHVPAAGGGGGEGQGEAAWVRWGGAGCCGGTRTRRGAWRAMPACCCGQLQGQGGHWDQGMPGPLLLQRQGAAGQAVPGLCRQCGLPLAGGGLATTPAREVKSIAHRALASCSSLCAESSAACTASL